MESQRVAAFHHKAGGFAQEWGAEAKKYKTI